MSHLSVSPPTLSHSLLPQQERLELRAVLTAISRLKTPTPSTTDLLPAFQRRLREVLALSSSRGADAVEGTDHMEEINVV